MTVAFSIVKSGDIGATIPFATLPIELTVIPTVYILSPAQAGQNVFKIDVGSLTIAARTSGVPIDVSLMYRWPQGFRQIGLYNVMGRGTDSPYSFMQD